MAVTDAFRSLRLPAFSRRFSLSDLLERWHDLLLVCLPERWARVLARRDERLIVVPDGATAKIYLDQSGQRSAMGDFDPQIPESLQAVLSGMRGDQRRTAVQVPPDQVLRRSVSFPAQVRDNLPQVMRYEIDRLSPFRADEVCFDFRVADGPTSGGKIAVELALCRRDQIADWLQGLRDAGVAADLVTWQGAWPKANLLPVEERPPRSAGAFGLTRLLLVLILLLAAAALATPVWQMRQIRDQRATQVAELKVQAEEVHEMRAALERARQGSVVVLQRKWEQPRMIDLVRELTERLPDDTWVQNLDFRDGETQIRGESAQATALIGLLDQAPGIAEVTFRSPVVQVSGSGKERFHISLKYVREETR